MNAEVERATIRIATEEVNRVLRERRIAHKVNAQVRQEMVDRLRQAIDQAVEAEVEGIERELPEA